MRMKYLHVIPSLNPERGGPAEGVKQLSAAAIRMNHRVEIATFDRPDNSWARDFDCPIHFVGPSYLKYAYAPRFSKWLRHNAARFDAVIVNGIWQYHSYGTWRLLRGAHSTPYYVFTHGMLDPWFKGRYPLKHLKKLLYWPWAEYRVLRDARAVLFTSEEERRLASQSFRRYRANEVVVNYGAPSPQGDPAEQRASFLKRFPQLDGKRILLFLSRIHPKKGCDLLVEAFAEAVQSDGSLRLVFAGPDLVGLQPRLVRLAERLGVADAVIWTGMLRGNEKHGAFRAAEVFILPSHQENFGIAVAEAMACGLPVLISNKINIWREIEVDQAGFVAADTLAGAKALLQRWLALLPAEREQMRCNALRCFQKRFHIDAVASNLLETLERCSRRPQQHRAA